MDKKMILIIDDETEMVEMMSMRLRAFGYDVEVAYDGSSGLEKVKQTKPDLVILDLMLPKIDGNQLCALLKKDVELKKIPVIVLTALDQTHDLNSPKEHHADFYMVKPFDPQELLAKIKELIKKHSGNN